MVQSICVVRMCCRFCFVCLVLYTCSLLIDITAATDTEDGSTYSELTPSTLITSIDAGNQDIYQIQDGKSEILNKDNHINKLMEEFGNGTVIMFEGFEHLLHKLGLGKIVIFDHSVKCHKASKDSKFHSFHKSHDHSSVLVDSMCDEGQELEDMHKHEHVDEDTHVVHDSDYDHDHDHDHDHGYDHDHDHDHDQDHNTNGIDTLIDEHDDSDQHNHVHDLDEIEIHPENHKEDRDTHRHKHEVGEESGMPKGNAQLMNNGSVNTVNQGQDETETPASHSKLHVEAHIKDKCLPATTLLYLSIDRSLQYLTKEKFRDLCPSLVYQVSHDTCHDHHTHQSHPHGNSQVTDQDFPPHGNDLGQGQETSMKGFSGVPIKVWGYSTVAVVIISLVGLLGVAVIPVMQKVFYNHLLQFLVALAVGALSGDALLHLLPHAISGGHEEELEGDEGDHSGAVFKGLCGLIGIYSFYLMERIITILTELKRCKKEWQNLKVRGDERLATIGERLAANCDEMMMSVHPNKALQGYAAEAHSEHCVISLENSQSISHQHDSGDHKSPAHHHMEAEYEDQTDMLSHSNGHAHRHSHSHSHCVDGAPDSIAAVAWMMILGDGMHKLSDGLAIGAAFSDSITGGFSTSVAMFCHELPHTIGDFAILLRAGMTPKQAIFYNCLSSVLSFIGMLIGVAIGNIENASLWIFAVVGGMFLYIALVDMLPEMSSVETKRGENPFCHLVLQLAGMLLGAGIMLLIALYEHSLKTVFD